MRKLDIKRATPTILSFIAAFGVVGTIVSTRHAARKEKELKKEEKMERIRCYIPPALIGTGTIVCIFSANILSQRQIKNLMSAYMLLEQSFRDYKSSLIDIYGEDAHEQIMERITKEKCDSWVVMYAPCLVGTSSLDVDESENPEIVRTFYDPHSNRMFETTLSKVIQAEYHVNRNFALGGEVHVDDFYEFLGLKPLHTDAPVGWTMEDECYWIDFNHHLTTLDDGMEVVAIEMIFEPGPII